MYQDPGQVGACIERFADGGPDRVRTIAGYGGQSAEHAFVAGNHCVIAVLMLS